MASANYLVGRRKYDRPQAMLWADNPGTLTYVVGGNQEDLMFVPDGYEVGANSSSATSTEQVDSFIILTDDNRQPIDFKIERIEKRERMINGRMRSYHIADKLNITTSWDMIPSRSFSVKPNFGETTGKSSMTGNFGKPSMDDQQFTTDGGAGGVEILKWYEEHKGSFWVYLSYDKYSNFADNANQYTQLKKYSQVIEMFISDFSYSVVKRGGSNFDFWNISVTLEEV